MENRQEGEARNQVSISGQNSCVVSCPRRLYGISTNAIAIQVNLKFRPGKYMQS
jgi:hypothetical protein